MISMNLSFRDVKLVYYLSFLFFLGLDFDFDGNYFGYQLVIIGFGGFEFGMMLLQIISPYNLYLNPKLVVKHYEFWRLITNFLYFRKMGNEFMKQLFVHC